MVKIPNRPIRFRMWNPFIREFKQVSYRLNTQDKERLEAIKQELNKLFLVYGSIELDRKPLYFPINYNVNLGDTLYLIFLLRNILDEEVHEFSFKSNIIKGNINWIYDHRKLMSNLLKKKSMPQVYSAAVFNMDDKRHEEFLIALSSSQLKDFIEQQKNLHEYHKKRIPDEKKEIKMLERIYKKRFNSN
tara:strand:+ start:4560 stop:5126 length:567 start_codon:yes stop_codon:yes gene_type:complete